MLSLDKKYSFFFFIYFKFLSAPVNKLSTTSRCFEGNVFDNDVSGMCKESIPHDNILQSIGVNKILKTNLMV